MVSNIENEALEVVGAYWRFTGLAGPSVAHAKGVIAALREVGMLCPSDSDLRGAVLRAEKAEAEVARLVLQAKGLTTTTVDYEKFASMFAGEIAVARTFSGVGRLISSRNIIRSVADIFVRDNHNFNRAAFYEACGIGKDGFA